jgi:hypothetical protein
MAAATITNRRVGSHGALKRETGDFTNVTAADYQLYTKLGGGIISFKVMGNDDGGSDAQNGDHDGAFYINFSDAGTTIAPGVVHIDASTLSANQTGITFMYEALGFG